MLPYCLKFRENTESKNAIVLKRKNGSSKKDLLKSKKWVVKWVIK